MFDSNPQKSWGQPQKNKFLASSGPENGVDGSALCLKLSGSLPGPGVPSKAENRDGSIVASLRPEYQ